MSNIVFKKTGKQIKEAVKNRRSQLQQRLEARNKTLAKFMKDEQKVRSYFVRSTHPYYASDPHMRGGYVLHGKGDISSEERQEIDQLCSRIFEIEQEIHRLAYIDTHLEDDREFELTFDELIGYGFEA